MLLLALALQMTAIPLENVSVEDDGVTFAGVSFSPDGQSLLVPHARSGSVVAIDVPTRTPVMRGAEPGLLRMGDGAVDPTGTYLVLSEAYELTRRRLSDLTKDGSVDSLFGFGQDLAIDQVGRRAVLHEPYGDRRTMVINLASMTLEREFNSAFVDDTTRSGRGLAFDDVTYVSVGSLRIFAYDVTTGAQVAQQTFAGPNTFARFLAVTEDRTRAVVVAEDRTGAVPNLVVETFQLPSLNPISSFATPATGSFFIDGDAFSLDASGNRALLGNDSGCWSLDLVSGASMQLTSREVYDGSLSISGQYAALQTTDGTQIVDASTGAVLFAGEISGGLVRSPVDSLFAFAGGSDRVKFLEVLPSGSVRFDDVRTNLGPDIDGPFEFAELPDGKRVAAVGRDGDVLQMVDLEGVATAGAVSVEREPTDVAALENDLLAVVHGAGASLVTVDASTLSVIGRTPLAGPANQVVAAGGTLVWVQVQGEGIRSLELVDAASSTVVTSIPLAPAENPAGFFVSELQNSVVFDLPRQRAYAMSPVEGRVELIGLAAASVIDVEPIAPSPEAQLFISPDGGRVTSLSAANQVVSWTVGAGGMTPSWTYACSSPQTQTLGSALGHQSADGSRYQFSFGNDVQGSCERELIFEAATGALVSPGGSTVWAGITRSFPMERDERLGHSLRPATQFRFEGDRWVGDLVGTPQSTYFSPAQAERSRVTGKTLVLARDVFERQLLIIDPLNDSRTVLCDPAVPNSTGVATTLDVQGGGLAGGTLVGTVSGLQPGSMAGYLLVADAATAPRPVVNSVGRLCLGGSIGRFINQVQLADASGEQRYSIDLKRLPLSAAPIAASPGETWTFQAWHRDQTPAGAPTSNFSAAVAVEVR